MRQVADRTGAEAEASKTPGAGVRGIAGFARGRGARRRCLHRLNVASQDLDREETRAKDRIAELELRLVQFAADAEREQRLAADAQAALARLAAEEETIRADGTRKRGRRSGIDAKVAEADGELSAAEKIFSDVTTALADLAASAARSRMPRASKASGWRAWPAKSPQSSAN